MNCEAVKDRIVSWLTEKLKASGQKGFVIGISGGVDSALVSALCALTGKQVMALTMPIHQEQNQAQRALDHINFFLMGIGSITHIDIDLTNPFETLRSSLPEFVKDDSMAMANTRARLRMATLYAHAGHMGYLVAGTGNKVEDFGVGFFTKYGDGGVDLSPIGDLSKTQVRELAKHLGVSQAIVVAKPTDGLWEDNRGDEDQIGAAYEELEWAMAFNEVGGKDLFCLTDRQKNVLHIYRTRHSMNKHKMEPIPVCEIPKIIL